MADRKFIFCADDFGVNNNINKGILDGSNAGIITAASLCANGDEFDTAVNEFLPDCTNLSICAHLCITRGSSLSHEKILTDNNNNFNNRFIAVVRKSLSHDFLNAVEKEFRAQIDKISAHTRIDCINSHGNIHSIPKIFEITCKLASEYGIPYVRLPKEKVILLNNMSKYINPGFPAKLAKVVLMNSFADSNTKTACKYGIKTNSILLGELYKGQLDLKTFEDSLGELNEEKIAELSIIPDKQKQKTEYSVFCDKITAEKIFRAGFELTNYRKIK